MLGVSQTDREVSAIAVGSLSIRLGDYFQSDIVSNPLPTNLLDRLADLYWTERESDLAI